MYFLYRDAWDEATFHLAQSYTPRLIYGPVTLSPMLQQTYVDHLCTLKDTAVDTLFGRDILRKAEEMSLGDQLEVNISTGFIDMHEGVKS